MSQLRVYVDTCVFGGAFEAEFAKATQSFFVQARRGRFHLLISAVVRNELLMSPLPVWELMEEMLPYGEEVLLYEY